MRHLHASPQGGSRFLRMRLLCDFDRSEASQGSAGFESSKADSGIIFLTIWYLCSRRCSARPRRSSMRKQSSCQPERRQSVLRSGSSKYSSQALSAVGTEVGCSTNDSRSGSESDCCASRRSDADAHGLRSTRTSRSTRGRSARSRANPRGPLSGPWRQAGGKGSESKTREIRHGRGPSWIRTRDDTGYEPGALTAELRARRGRR
jgi:hypothetical protein